LAWASKLKWIRFQDSPVSFMESTAAVYIISALAFLEIIIDKLPFTPNRISAMPLIGRVITGAFSGFALCAAAGRVPLAGAVLGALGGVAGAFVGFRGRQYLVKNTHFPDFAVAIAEDIIAIGGGLLIVSQV
jgi:uncharacterized membrane protein